MHTPRLDRFSLPSSRRGWLTFAAVALLCAGIVATVADASPLAGIREPQVTAIESPPARGVAAPEIDTSRTAAEKEADRLAAQELGESDAVAPDGMTDADPGASDQAAAAAAPDRMPAAGGPDRTPSAEPDTPGGMTADPAAPGGTTDEPVASGAAKNDDDDATGEMSDADDPLSDGTAQVRLIQVQSQDTVNMPDFAGNRGSLVSFQLEVSSEIDLPADRDRIRLYLRSDAETGRFYPLPYDELTPDLSQLDLSADETVTAWLTFFIPRATQFDHASLMLRLDSQRDFTAEIPVEWD